MVFPSWNRKIYFTTSNFTNAHKQSSLCFMQLDPSLDRPNKNVPSQSIIERYIQLKGSKYVDEIIPYVLEQDVEDILRSFKIDVRIIGQEYENVDFTGKEYCIENGIEIYYNSREHRFSSTEIKTRLKK